ncbi:hypothetical protein QO010_000377 [Caulobacter ginsengisoli]|uniref:Uncharacterized protein n=1 Tax=Caulobacter ginsengisoli TaxID=400775 RepID=A0ABU0INN2_9CAUL|nr:phage tail tube protein [Caulobacter ginsengisoli]MDQ0462629.1 hypothetical protein [Caulobacter ginsengisoli]
MANEQGLLKQTVFAKQSQLGIPYPTTGGKIKRRTSAVFTKSVDTYESNEIVSHQQSTGANAGIVKTSGKLDGLISPGTYTEQFASLLRKDAAATAAITGMSITNITASGSVFTATRGSGDFLQGGVKIGDIGRWTAGGFNGANSNKNFLVTAVTATTISYVTLGAVPGVTETGPVTGSTWTTVGKKTWVPTSGHVNDYWTVEEWYSGLGRSELFRDCKIAKADVTVPATGNATVSFDVPGLSRVENGTQQIATPAAETTTNVLTAVGGLILVNGVATPITGIQFSIDGHVQPGEAEVGTNQIGDHVRGEISVSGQFTAKFSSVALQALYTAQTPFTIIVVLTDGSLATSDFVSFVIQRCKVFGDTPDDGEAKEIIRTYPFTAQINASGGPASGVGATADLQSIISIQDSQAP